jgi:hypothetical protein
MLTTALNSIESNDVHPSDVFIVRCGCPEVKEVIDKLDTSNYSFNLTVVENTTGKSFQNQINYGASLVNTEYFSFLEFDDSFSSKWFKNVRDYVNSYPEVDMFLPIISDFSSNDSFVGFTNEGSWAYNFSESLGVIDHDVLLEYPNINPDGMVVRTSVFKEIGGYKPSMVLTFNYEFLLRFTNGGRNIMVIPKVGYKHVNMRPGSLFWDYKYSEDIEIKLTPDEAKFWMETAKKEYLFTEDRKIRYQNEAAE